MRPVRVEVYETGDPFASSNPAACLSTTLTYLDNANRVALTAVYAKSATIPSTYDPATFAPNTTLPTADLILGESVKPISLTETIYAADGTAIERRDYDITDTSAPYAYRSTFTYSGLGGQTTFQLSGESCQTSRLDSLGRVISSSTIAPRTDSGKLAFDLEVARTDNFYDADSNLKRIVRWERVTPWTAGNEKKVVQANAVWSTTVNWYDANKRLIATGDVGAGNSAENITVSAPTSTFTSSSTAAMAAPTWFDDNGTIGSAPTISTTTGVVNRAGTGGTPVVPVGVPLTIYHFDSKGRNDLTATPRAVIPSGGGGSSNDYDLVKYEYTGLGKLARKTENPFPASGEQSRTTSYEYRFGQVSRVIVDSDPSTTDPDQWTALEFGANDINRHGADVVDLTLADGDGTTSPKDGALSKSASAVRAMYLLDVAPPNQHTGSAIGAQYEHLFFRYDFLGRLAERVDNRGVAMRYRYDALDRLKSIEVGTYANTEHTGTFTPGYPSSMDPGGSGVPVDRVGYVEYSYAEQPKPAAAITPPPPWATSASTQRSPPTGPHAASANTPARSGR